MKSKSYSDVELAIIGDSTRPVLERAREHFDLLRGMNRAERREKGQNNWEMDVQIAARFLFRAEKLQRAGFDLGDDPWGDFLRGRGVMARDIL